MTEKNSAVSAACISLQDVDVAFGSQRVLDRLTWTVATHRVVGLLGRNGAGKTTLIETLLGLREADAGQTLLWRQPSTVIDDATRERIGYVPQRPDLFEWLTANQLLAYMQSFYPRWNTAKVDALLARWSIARDKPIGQLSGGEQQRLSIIRALAHEPELLVLDEPVSSLDPVGRRDFLRELVEQVVDRQTTMVFSTHILSDLQRVAVDVAFLAAGRIAIEAPLDHLLDRCVRLVGAADDVQRFAKHKVLEPLGPGDASIWIAGEAAAAPMAESTREVSVDRVTLEDIFIALTDGGSR